ncbi:MAG: SDR family oxidoreductase [Bryobacteraceae bacterium]
MILLIGATGTSVGETARQLGLAGVEMRAAVRDLKKGEGLRQLGIDVVQADAAEPASLEAAMAGADKVMFAISLNEHQAAREKNIVDAAVRQGVVHILKISAMGAQAARRGIKGKKNSADLVAPRESVVREFLDSASVNSRIRLGKVHGETEAAIEQSGIPYTLLRPALFMQNFFRSASTITREGLIYLPIGDARVGFVDARDIAAVAVKVLTDDGHRNKSYDITGPEALTGDEIAEKLSLALGSPVRYTDPGSEKYKKQMLESGTPEWTANTLIEMYEALRKSHGAPIADTVRRITGEEPASFDQFARDHSRVFLNEGAAI